MHPDIWGGVVLLALGVAVVWGLFRRERPVDCGSGATRRAGTYGGVRGRRVQFHT
jgi:hypothetical protein